jgi:hypothetical protein
MGEKEVLSTENDKLKTQNETFRKDLEALQSASARAMKQSASSRNGLVAETYLHLNSTETTQGR